MHIAVIGMGTMGPGIAARLARGGHSVAAHDSRSSAIDKAREMLPVISRTLDMLEIDDQGGTVSFAESLGRAVADAELIVENIPENADQKAALYGEIGPLAAPDAIVATDTSGISITKLQSHIANPERFVGMHWSNPPHIIPMIEVIAGEKTAPGVADTVVGLIRDLGLVPVLVKRDMPGFVENRVLYALLRECVDLVERGAIEPEDLDTCVRWGIGYKLSVVGPMRLLDMAGLDIYSSVSSFLNAELCSRADVSPLIEAATSKGRLGMKSGAGMFDYTDEELKVLPRTRGAKLVAIRKILEN